MASAVGLETKGGVFTPLIARGRAVPCVQTEMFTTAEDGQQAIQVRVFHGDGGLVVPQQRLGSYEVRMAEKAPRGTPTTYVSFQVDEYGTFCLTAKDGAGKDVQVVETV